MVKLMVNSKINISKVKLSLVVTCACLLSFLSFKLYSSSFESPKNTYNSAEANQIILTSDINEAFDIEDMYSTSDVIVIGTYTGFDSTWNTARNVDDITLEDEKFYSEGWIYDFEVAEVLKGNLGLGEIKVSHYYSNTFDVEISDAIVDELGIIIEPATEINYYPVTVFNNLFVEPEIGGKYMLFLRYNNELDMHFGSIEPFSIKFDERNRAMIQQNISEVYDTTVIQIESGEAKVIDMQESKAYLPKSRTLTSDVANNNLSESVNGKTIYEIINEIQSF